MLHQSNTLANTSSSPPWLVPDLLPAFISMIFAGAKAGKSIMTVQLAHALATNSEFLGHQVERQLRVLYYQSDLPEDEWKFQLQKLNRNEGWYTIWDMPGLLASKAKRDELKSIVKAEKFDLTIFDSFVSCSEPADLDKPMVIRTCISRLHEITQDKPIWLVHLKDRISVSAAGSFASAGVSTLIHLTETSIEIRGRYVQSKMKLKRGKEGLWVPVKTKPKDPRDLYKL